MEQDISSSPERLARAIELLRHPRPGSKIEAAQRLGVDLEQLIENLRLTPAERVQKALAVIQAAEAARQAEKPEE